MNQKGFTLIEILVAMAVGGMIMAVALLSIYQIVWGTARSNDQVAALTDVNYASLWLKYDLQMVQSTNLTDGAPPQSSVRLSWNDNTGWSTDNESSHSSTYTLSGTNLLRTYDGNVKIIGRYIASIGFSQNGGVITVDITAAGPGILERAEPLGFSVLTHMRSEGAQ